MTDESEQKSVGEQAAAEGADKRGDIVTLFAGFRDGKQAAEMTRQLDKGARAVIATGKKATMTIKIELTEDDEESGRLAVSIDSEVKVPRIPRTEYLHARKSGKNAGELVRDNPETEAMMGRGLFSGQEGDEA